MCVIYKVREGGYGNVKLIGTTYYAYWLLSSQRMLLSEALGLLPEIASVLEVEVEELIQYNNFSKYSYRVMCEFNHLLKRLDPIQVSSLLFSNYKGLRKCIGEVLR